MQARPSLRPSPLRRPRTSASAGARIRQGRDRKQRCELRLRRREAEATHHGDRQSAREGDVGDEEGIFAEINITPLTDIFLVLLIIFMVTSSVMADAGARSGLRVNLPKGATKEVQISKKI